MPRADAAVAAPAAAATRPMMRSLQEEIVRRQLIAQNGTQVPPDQPEDGNWWWTPDGLAVRYAIVAVLFGALLLFFAGGYWHAQRRIRKGLTPLRYHRWMLKSRPITMQPRPAASYSRYADPNRDGYQMEGYPPPPPAYHHAEAPPPSYQPPPGASKIIPNQTVREVETTEAGEASGSASTTTAGRA